MDDLGRYSPIFGNIHIKAGHMCRPKVLERNQSKHQICCCIRAAWIHFFAAYRGRRGGSAPFFGGSTKVRSVAGTSRRMWPAREEANCNWKQPSELDAENSSEARISCTACGYRIIQRFLLVKSAHNKRKTWNFRCTFFGPSPTSLNLSTLVTVFPQIQSLHLVLSKRSTSQGSPYVAGFWGLRQCWRTPPKPETLFGFEEVSFNVAWGSQMVPTRSRRLPQNYRSQAIFTAIPKRQNSCK